MKPDSARFPFAHSAHGARWPSDIPHTERRRWKDSRRNFSTVWTVPAGTGFDDLRIELPLRYMVLAVRQGAIRLSHGAREVCLVEGQAVAVSVRELQAEIPAASLANVFEVHLFSRMPPLKQIGCDSPFGMMVGKQGIHPPGMFSYPTAGALLNPGLHGGKLLDNAVELLWRLYVCGLQSTVRFVASGRAGKVEVWSERMPCSPGLADLSEAVADVAW